MTLEHRQYEKGWGRCVECNARRPHAEMRPSFRLRGVRMVRIWACIGQEICAALKATLSTSNGKVSP